MVDDRKCPTQALSFPSLSAVNHARTACSENLFYGSIVLARRNAAAMRPHPPTSACNSTKAPSSRLSQIWNPSQSVLLMRKA